MSAFLIVAALMAAIAAAIVALPLLRDKKNRIIGALAAVLLAGAAAGLYPLWSNWNWHAPVEAQSMPAPDVLAMVAKLEQHMREDPGDLAGWLMLGRSYVVLQELPLALRAFERAERLSGGKNVDALLGEAEVLALEDPAELKGRAGRLIDRALELAPDSGKVLFFGATVAATRGQLPLARERFARILAMNPPDNVRPILEQQIRYIDERLAAAPAASAAGQPETGADSAAAVRVNITLAPGVTGANTAPLFVFVRTAGAPGGPPLAAKRLESHFPQSVTLTPADSMIPGRSFATGQAVQVVARIARSGSPVGARGDPYGEIIYRVGEDGQLNLVIDRLTP